MSREYGIDFRLVPYEGEAPIVTALLGDNVDAGFTSNAEVTMTQIDAGELRLLATAAPERLEFAPGVPTLAELGYESLTFGNSIFVLVAPGDTPPEIVARLEAALETALEDPEVREVIGEVRLAPEFIGGEALMDQLREERDALQPILEELFG